MAKSKGKNKTLKSHRRTSSSLRYNLRKHQEFGKREKKKEKQDISQETVVACVEQKDLTLADIKKAFPDMHTRDALEKLAELRSAV